MSCTAPALSDSLKALGHRCLHVHHACLWRRSGEEKDRSNSELVLPGGLASADARAALRMRVRQVHIGHTQNSLRSMGFLRAATADDPPSLSAPSAWSACVPVVLSQPG